MSTPFIEHDPEEMMLEHLLTTTKAKLDQRRSDQAKEQRAKSRKAALVGLAKSVKDHTENVARFDSMIASEFENLRVAVEERHRDFRNRMFLPEAKVGVDRSTQALVLVMNAKLEATMNLRLAEERHQEALRVDQNAMALEKKPQI
jgi:hypothetical protein